MIMFKNRKKCDLRKARGRETEREREREIYFPRLKTIKFSKNMTLRFEKEFSKKSKSALILFEAKLNSV